VETPPRSFICLRHGVTDWNRQGRFQGRTDVPLNDDGILQAHAAALRLQNTRLDQIVASPLVRAVKTAEIVATSSSVPLAIDDGIIECDFGSLEGRSITEVMKENDITEMGQLTTILPPEQLAVALENASNLRHPALGNFIQRFPPTLPPILRTVHAHPVAVRTGLIFAQLLPQSVLEVSGDSVLHLLSLFVNLVPLHAENLRQHPLDQMMPVHHAISDFAPLARQRYFPRRSDADQAIALQTPDRHGDRRRRNLQPARQRSRDDHFALALRLRDGLQVILFGDGDAHSPVIVICEPYAEWNRIPAKLTTLASSMFHC